MTQLYTAADVKKVRELILKKQNGYCALTKEIIPAKQAVLDHSHKSNYVRAVLHRQANAALGKIENLYVRYLSYWYNGTLPQFLRECAEYLEQDHAQDYLHPGWLKSIKTKFNKLNSRQKEFVLVYFGYSCGKNDKERKDIFAKLVLNRSLDYKTILAKIGEAQGVV